MNTLAVVDGFGIYGNAVHYALVLVFVGSAFIIFFYLWQKGRLDMDEEAKYLMMENKEDLPLSMNEEQQKKGD